MDIGNIIKNGRIKKRLTQEQLGKLVGVNKVSIWSWERGKSFPSGDILVKLGEILDIVDDLFPSHKAKSELEIKIDQRFTKIEQALERHGIRFNDSSKDRNTYITTGFTSGSHVAEK